MKECPGCGETYTNLGNHLRWESVPCEYPDLTQRQKEILTGLMMGDGSVNGYDKSTDTNPHIQTEMVSDVFLDWLDTELGVYSNGLELVNTAEEQAARNNSDGEYQDVYGLTTMRAPVFYQWGDWYSSGEKRFPKIELTPTIAGVWYVCDGWKNKQISGGRPYACIGAENEYDNRDGIVKMFEDQGFGCSWIRGSVRLQADASEDFWDWAEQPPGFERKF